MGKPKKGKKGQEDFSDDEVDLDPLAGTHAAEEASEPASKTVKKKGKKAKRDDDLDDVASEIAAMSIEANKGLGNGAMEEETVSQPAPKKKTAEEEDVDAILAALDEPSEKKKDKKKKKKGGDGEEAKDEEENKGEEQAAVEKAAPKVVTIDDYDSEEDTKKKKKKKGKKEKEEEEGAKEGGEEGEAEEAGTVKTAAQKKKEKKEREKQKKMQQQKKKDGDGGAKDEAGEGNTPEREETPAAGDEADAKPSAEALKEHLAKLKEEEEKRKQEELEAERREEERVRKLEEEKQLEEERRMKKKMKKKEREERLKKEGRFMTEKQKQDRMRLNQMLENIKEQGGVVPNKDEVPKKRPIYGKKKKDSQPKAPVFLTLAGFLTFVFVRIEGEESEKSPSPEDERPVEQAKRREAAEKLRTTDKLRAPVVCVLGHVDTGKTKILDKLRRTNVQDGEAGGITQQIGATNVPHDAILDKTKMCKEFGKQELKLPGLLIIDTPGHESFSNLRSRGSSLCDIAILVIDIMHGLEPQTIESLNLLKQRKTPFIVALNKIDRLYQWKTNPNADIVNTVKRQTGHTKSEFDERTQMVITQLAEEGLNAALFYENKNPKEYVSLVPTSAHSGDGMGNLVALICELCQSMLAKRLSYSQELQATVMEVKAIHGLGTTIDVVLVNGKLCEGDTMVLAGTEGPIITPIRGLLMPQPMKELRVKNQYEHHKEVMAAQGVKIIGKDLEKSLAGLPLYVAHDQDEVEYYKQEVERALQDALKSIRLSDRGVFVQASTLGSLEALLEFLRTSKIKYAGINIGPVHKKDIMKASIMLEHDPQYAVILAFDVKVEREAQELADHLGVTIFTADIIYHLFDKFTAYRAELLRKKQEEFKHVAVFPCKLRILPQYIFNSRDPIVVGVVVESGFLKEGTPLCVPSKEWVMYNAVLSVGIEWGRSPDPFNDWPLANSNTLPLADTRAASLPLRRQGIVVNIHSADLPSAPPEEDRARLEWVWQGMAPFPRTPLVCQLSTKQKCCLYPDLLLLRNGRMQSAKGTLERQSRRSGRKCLQVTIRHRKSVGVIPRELGQFVDIGRVSSIEFNHKPVDIARQGQEVCIKIQAIPGEAPKMFGRHFDETDLLVSKISRESIDAVKDYFRKEMTKNDWMLIMELKKLFQIL
ncbi:hypothetical protein BaRGS_00012266 [Batillaria attramentaria]|uniref:Eukaryotic translation initiation factor 5B n=1 Tax=Batillaria attramentaria TaxID=370345 RepID=A0ABD0LBS0_9CAEN